MILHIRITPVISVATPAVMTDEYYHGHSHSAICAQCADSRVGVAVIIFIKL